MTLTPRSLFNIILKIFGLFFLKEIVTEIPNTIAVSISYSSMSEYGPTTAYIFVSLLIPVFYLLVAFQFLFRTNNIISVLKLDQGFFEEEFSFEERQENKISLSTAEILTISIIIIGGLILMNEVPDFCRQVYVYMSDRNSLYRVNAPKTGDILASGVKILLALLIIGERKRIIDFMVGRMKEKTNGND